jgi:Fe-S cluster biogenesis protein NfuA
MPAPKDEIVRLVREVLAPMIQADGGELYLVSVEDSAVALHLAGRFSGCPGNTLARRRVLEPLIAAAAPGATLTVTTGPLVPKGATRLVGLGTQPQPKL